MRAANSTSTRLAIYREHNENDDPRLSGDRQRTRPIRDWTVRAVLAMLTAAGITAVCLVRGINGPFGPEPGPRNLAFWVFVGMCVGLTIRISLAGTAYLANSLRRG